LKLVVTIYSLTDSFYVGQVYGDSSTISTCEPEYLPLIFLYGYCVRHSAVVINFAQVSFLVDEID
jgi:hypothetical protein